MCSNGQASEESNCFVSRSEYLGLEDGQHKYRTDIDYPFLTKSDRFKTNSAIWISMSEGADFNPTKEWNKNHLFNQCCCGDHNCWMVEQFQEGEYKFNRGRNPLDTSLNFPRTDVPITFDTLHEIDPWQAHAERMVICDGDVNSLPKPEVPTVSPDPAMPECEEIPKCSNGENQEEINCYVSRSEFVEQKEDGPQWLPQHRYLTKIDYPFLNQTDRFNTNSAIWIVMNEGAEFNATEEWHSNWLTNQCCCGDHNCWMVEQFQKGVYKFNRGKNPLNTKLNLPMTGVPIEFSTFHDIDPEQANAERMVICNGEVNSLPMPNEPTVGPDTPKPECCDGLAWYADGKDPMAWSKTDMTNQGQAIYMSQDDEPKFLSVAKIDDKEEWLVDRNPFPTNYRFVDLVSGDSQKCPDQASWGNQRVECNKCDKRIRPCQAWDDPNTTDCFVWESEYTGDNEEHSYRGTLTYPFLGQTKYYQANKSVWINFKHNIQRNDLTVQSECEMDQNEFCWIRNKNGPKFFQFTRGQDFRQAKLDFVGITVNAEMNDRLNGDEFDLDAVFICDADNHASPEHDGNWYLVKEDPAPYPPICSMDSIDDAKVDWESLSFDGFLLSKQNAKKAATYWNKNIIEKFKSLFSRSQFNSCKYDGDFFCHDLKPKDSDFRSMYNWARSLGVERLGACGGFRQFDKKLEKWADMVGLVIPELDSFNCPSVCQTSSYHQYIMPYIDHAAENFGFTKASFQIDLSTQIDSERL